MSPDATVRSLSWTPQGLSPNSAPTLSAPRPIDPRPLEGAGCHGITPASEDQSVVGSVEPGLGELARVHRQREAAG